MTLDDIWDAPVSPTTPHAGTVSPQKRPIEALFLSGSDNEDEQPAPKRPVSRPDVDALFADIDNDEDEEDDLRYKPLAPALDLDALHKQATAKHVLTPHQILPSSSPPRNVGLDEGDEGNDKKGKGKDDKEGKKERRKVATLDEACLVGATGFPQLIKDIKGFKVKGKGHEVGFTGSGLAPQMTGSLLSIQTSIGFSKSTSFGLIDYTQKLRSRTPSSALKNYVTRNECRCDRI